MMKRPNNGIKSDGKKTPRLMPGRWADNLQARFVPGEATLYNTRQKLTRLENCVAVWKVPTMRDPATPQRPLTKTLRGRSSDLTPH